MCKAKSGLKHPDEGWTEPPEKKRMELSYPRCFSYLEKLLGHVRTATLVHDVSNGKNNLESDDHEDEEAHAGSGRGDSY